MVVLVGLGCLVRGLVFGGWGRLEFAVEAVVVLRVLLSGGPVQVCGARESFDGAPGRPVLWFAVRRGVDLPGPVDARIL